MPCVTAVWIYHPKEASSQTDSSSVAVYLPRSSVLQNEAHDASNVETLRDTLSCHLVKINYRCGKDHKFPAPVHDMLTGYDWIINNLLPKRAISRPGRSEHVGRLAICGELLGGTLGLGLALSECRIGEPGIVAAAINNPIVDWTTVHDRNWMPFKPQSKAHTSNGLAWDDLAQYRETLFRRPSHYFDPFASPMLFFRSAELEVPDYVEEQPLDEMEELIRFEREESLREQLGLGAQPDIVEPEPMKSVKKRRVSRRFPSKALSLRLPNVRIESGSDAVVSGQAIELAHQLRQSFERQRKPGPARNETSRSEDRQDPDVTVDEVRHCWHPGLGLWDDTAAGKARILEAAMWLKEHLAK
ncbi:hypothetical protein M409DRAFT_62829 [Zasmidium cellare ATCC 36951]|uniref:Alpha/beta hydrolase fold-3 domain-containing protein n=1 Tax=Zasmidium cellare ATCC 36951 TaxID=1080233 RepID=A0A6A6D1H0_ZASCE|nr:uncharacterized protein M409DRAFT_62829 [Zasmidium cellare ATCC 36951]KAF2173274.1 hypothetical protein M409DRAFT_62829 [Zasmidium cellare ATCC 36951]